MKPGVDDKPASRIQRAQPRGKTGPTADTAHASTVGELHVSTNRKNVSRDLACIDMISRHGSDLGTVGSGDAQQESMWCWQLVRAQPESTAMRRTIAGCVRSVEPLSNTDRPFDTWLSTLNNASRVTGPRKHEELCGLCARHLVNVP